MQKKKNAFTLIELLVVIAIIALLLAISTSALRLAKEHARRTICGTNLKSIGTAVFCYAGANNDFLPETDYQRNLENDPKPFRTYFASFIDITRPFGDHVIYGPRAMGSLWDAKLIDTPETFYCPSSPKGDPAAGFFSLRYEDYVGPSGWPWNSQETGNERNVRSSYMYLPQSANSRDVHGFPAIATKASQMTSSMTLTTGALVSLEYLPHTRNKQEAKSSSSAGGVNVLFSDGSVRFCNDSAAFDPSLWVTRVGSNNDAYRKIIKLLH